MESDGTRAMDATSIAMQIDQIRHGREVDLMNPTDEQVMRGAIALSNARRMRYGKCELTSPPVSSVCLDDARAVLESLKISPRKRKEKEIPIEEVKQIVETWMLEMASKWGMPIPTPPLDSPP
jgi:hypothetical protein